MEKGGSERELTYEGFDRFSDCTWILVEHVPQMRSDNRKYQHVMFPVYSMHCEMVQEEEDVFRSRMFPALFGPRCKMTVHVDLVVLAGKFCHHEFVGDVSAGFETDCQRREPPARIGDRSSK